MKKILLAFLLATTAISCTNSSSSDAPPAGKDGEKLVGEKPLSFGGKNADIIQIAEPGKDLVLAVGFPLDQNTRGQIRVLEQQTDLEKAVERAPKPLDPRIVDYLKTVCYLKDTPHRWVIRRQNVDTTYGAGQVMDFDFGSAMYLVIETRGKPDCKELHYNFTAELMNSSLKPQPTPEPTPVVPAVPAGSESVVMIAPYNPANFKIIYDRGEGRNFTYQVNMLVDGHAFAKDLNVEKVFVNVFDRVSNNYVAEWTMIAEQAPAKLPAEFRLQFTLDKFSAPIFIVDRQKDMVLTFAINAPDASVLPIRSLELGTYCQIARANFIEPKSGAVGCP